VADEELAQEGEALVDAPEVETPEPPKEPTASELAAEMGWTPKDQWQGDPDKWKPADQFIRDGRDIQQTTSRELRAMREQVERLSSTSAQILQDKLAEQAAQWEARFNQAVEDGDTATAAKLAEQRPSAAPQQAVTADPTVQAWVAKNEWFTKDPLAQARAAEISDRLKHLSVPDQLAQVERAIRKEFPEHFPAPTKPPPATQTGATRAANPGNRVKGFADMPQASQQAALDFERLNNVPKDEFAKRYWANEAKKGSRA
jgi:hypothetical protein